MKTGKEFKVCANRVSLIGDTITSLCVLGYMRKLYPDCYNTLSIAKKTSQSAQLYFNHPYVDRIHVNEFLENPRKDEYDFLKSHDIWAPPNIEHPQQDWQNYHHMVDENFVMLGIDYTKLSIEERTPKLVQWFDVTKYNKTVAIWPFANYGGDKKRNPDVAYYKPLLNDLLKMGYKVFHFGHFNEPVFVDLINDNVENCTKLPLFEQIKMSLGCDAGIFTDSGSSLALGAYGFPQVTLLTNWNVGHKQNFYALEPRNKNNISLFAENGCNNIPRELVLEKIKLLTS